MTWFREDFPDKFVEVGLWRPVYADIAFNAIGRILSRGRVRAADALFLEKQVQATDYVFRYVTNELLGLNVGDIVDHAGVQYKLLEPPKLEGSSAFFSSVRVERIGRVYPKTAIDMGVGVLPPVPGPGLGDMARVLTRTAAQSLAAYRIVRDVGAAQVDYADNTVAAHAASVLGFTMGSANFGIDLLVKNEGELENSAWNWTPNTPIWVGANGFGTQSTIAVPARYVQRVAFAMTPTKVFIEIEPPTYLR